MSYPYQQEPSAPVQYPSVGVRPIPPVRSEYSQDPQQQQTLLPSPTPPRREDKPAPHSHADAGSRRNVNEEESLGDLNDEGTCNYNRYATRKTISHVLLIVALLTSNGMQLRILALQKHHDGVWIASLVLAIVSILIQFGLIFISYQLIKSDIRIPRKQSMLEKYNNLALIIIALLTVINVIINALMITANSTSFLDTRSLEILQQRT